jgi:ABC-2 type transport system permease protein
MIRLIRAEFTKLATTRLIYGLAAAMAAFAVLTVVVGVTTAGTQGNPPLSAFSLARLVPAPASMLTGVVLLVAILGMAGEFRHQTITHTFLVTPDRGRMVAAKLAAHGLVGLVFAAVTIAVTVAVAAPWLAAEGVSVAPTAELSRALLGILAAAALYGMLGVAVGALVRNQLAAVVVAVAWLLVVEGLLIVLLHAPGLYKWLPGGAADALTGAHPDGSQLPMWGGALLLAAYALAMAMIASRLTIRRDIT